MIELITLIAGFFAFLLVFCVVIAIGWSIISFGPIIIMVIFCKMVELFEKD